MNKSIKKIMALVLSVSTAMTTIVSLGAVAHAETGVATCRFEVIDTSKNASYEVKAKEGYKAYVVNYYISNFGMDEKVEDTDTILKNISMKLNVSDNSKVEQTSWKKAARSGKNPAANGQYGSVIPAFGDPVEFKYDQDSERVIVVWTNRLMDPYDWESESGNEEKKFFSNIVYVANDASVTLTIESFGLALCDYEGNSADRDFISYKYNMEGVQTRYISFPTGTEIVLGESTVAATGIEIASTVPSTMTVNDTFNLSDAYATVTPDNASDKTVAWSVENGTGEATIVNNVLTATKAGAVTLKATANGGTKVYGTKTITITEPAPTKPTVTVSTHVGNSGKSWAWLLTITNHMTGFDYKGQFKSGGDTENVDINVDGIAGSAEFRKIIVLETEKASPTFTAKAEAVN